MAHNTLTRNDWLRIGSILLVVVGALILLYPFWPLDEAGIHLGLDLQGGARLILEPEGIEEMNDEQQQDTIDRIITILNNRVDQYGLANAEIKQLGTTRVLVNLPGTDNPQEARRLIGQMAVLQFYKVIEAGSSPNVDLVPTSAFQELFYDRDDIPYIVESEPLLTGAALADARVQVGDFGELEIRLNFTQEGAEQFVSALRKLQVNDQLAIVLDGRVYSAPLISQDIKDAAARGGWREVKEGTRITGGRGGFSKEEATRISIVLRTGALPVSVNFAQEDLVGPTLGNDSIRRGMITIVTGFLLILLYMPIYYRLLGLVADIALVLNMVIVFASLSLFGATLTLPGIAGIILTIGMTVDANVIIFERIKEERRTGKSPLAAVRSGFEKSLSTLLDANITTLLIALILLLIGTGPIKGFAITLGIGVVGSLYCALVASKLLLEKAGFSDYLPVRVSAEAS
jgi:preprotein translocase subunit SecD